MYRSIVLGLFAASVITGCGAGATPPSMWSGPTPSTPAPASPAAPSPSPVAGVLRCEGLPEYRAPEAWYRDAPIYVANEQPIEEVRAWASTQPGFEDLWIDRDHLGWLAVAFSQDAEARQADVEARFPDAGVVVVPVDWSKADLERLQDEVGQKLSPRFEFNTAQDILRGVVMIGFGVLTPEHVAAVEELFPGERVCVGGQDPAEVPQPGPQPIAGDGWRLLGAEDETGRSYRTGIASDAESYRSLWADSGLEGNPPEVDFENEVAIWFGAVHGSSCPGLRLDDVVVDRGQAIVHGAFVNPEGILGCTDDAVPHSFVVALERTRLPKGPFWIQLDADDPPNGARDERTIVEVDLSEPGSVAPAGTVHPDDPTPLNIPTGPGEFVEPGFPTPYRTSVHCGAEWLGPLNHVPWRTDEATGPDWLPEEWRAAATEDETLDLVLLMETGSPPRLEATANNYTVIYEAVVDAIPGCD